MRTRLWRLQLGAAVSTLLLAILLTVAESASADSLTPVSTANPVISGTRTQGQVLSTTSGSWDPPSAETFAYQWQRSADTGQTWANISGCTQSLTAWFTSFCVGQRSRR